jgi:hypothetical protein
MCFQRKLENKEKLSKGCMNYKLQIPFELERTQTQKKPKTLKLDFEV